MVGQSPANHGRSATKAAAAAAVMLVSAVLVWRRSLFRLIGRLHYSAFALCQALLITWLGYWGFFFILSGVFPGSSTPRA